MLGWAVTFLIIALIAAVLGFGGIAASTQSPYENRVKTQCAPTLAAAMAADPS